MPIIRVFHNGATVLGTEHRVDETYTDANRPARRADQDWFTADSDQLFDGEGLVPFESLEVADPAGSKALAVNATVRDQRRQHRRDRERGKGGELDQLYTALLGRPLTPAELQRMLILERGLD